MSSVTLHIELERVSGKFVSNDDLAGELADMVDVGSVYVDESEYEITDVSILTIKNGKVV